MGDSFTDREIDTDFYKTLPGLEQQYVNAETGQPEAPIPSIEQALDVVGTTSLSSEVIASRIRDWLENRRTRIRLLALSHSAPIDFEGPNPRADVDKIQTEIDRFLSDVQTRELLIRAEHIA
jgi:hypothetical protein